MDKKKVRKNAGLLREDMKKMSRLYIEGDSKIGQKTQFPLNDKAPPYGFEGFTFFRFSSSTKKSGISKMNQIWYKRLGQFS